MIRQRVSTGLEKLTKSGLADILVRSMRRSSGWRGTSYERRNLKQYLMLLPKQALIYEVEREHRVRPMRNPLLETLGTSAITGLGLGTGFFVARKVLKNPRLSGLERLMAEEKPSYYYFYIRDSTIVRHPGFPTRYQAQKAAKRAALELASDPRVLRYYETDKPAIYVGKEIPLRRFLHRQWKMEQAERRRARAVRTGRPRVR